MLKKTILVLALLIATAFTFEAGAQTKSAFPDLSKFEVKLTCHNDPPRIKTQKVVVELYLLNKNEMAPNNELITLIIVKETGKQFAAWSTISDVDASDPEKIKATRRTFARDGQDWREILDPEQYIREVVENAPPEYLLDYGYRPAKNIYAYRNLLKNADCSLHGPIG